MQDLHRHRLPTIASRGEQHRVALALIDLLFAFLYDTRTTQGEHSVESGWNITKVERISTRNRTRIYGEITAMAIT